MWFASSITCRCAPPNSRSLITRTATLDGCFIACVLAFPCDDACSCSNRGEKSLCKSSESSGPFPQAHFEIQTGQARGCAQVFHVATELFHQDSQCCGGEMIPVRGRI